MRLYILFLIAAALLTGEIRAQQTLSADVTQVNITQFPLVQLNVQVRRQGAVPVALAQLSPMVTENGIPQVIESLSCPDDAAIRLSLAILLDRSRSMAMFPNSTTRIDPDSSKFRAAKKAITTFLDFLTPRDEAAIFSFTTTTSGGPFNPSTNLFRVEEDFSTNFAELKGSLVPLQVFGGTRIWEAIIEAIKLLRVRAGRKVLILVTDGRNTDGNEFRPVALQDAVNAGIPVYSVGIGTDVDAAELTALANATGGRFFNAPDTDGLQTIFSVIADELITDECVLTYRSTNTCLDGKSRLVNLELSANGLVAKDDTTYVVPDAGDPITLTLDLPDSLASRNQITVPVLPNISLPSLTPVTYSMKVSYDRSFMQWLSFSLAGTMSEGLPVTVTETSPGLLSISMPGGTPARLSGSLLDLAFNVFAVGMDTLTTMKVTEGAFSSLCPWKVTTAGDMFRILACEENYTVSGGDEFIAASGTTIEVPVKLEPAPADTGRFIFRGTLNYDDALLSYRNITLSNGMVKGSALVTPGIESMDIVVDGIVSNKVPLLATVRFFTAKTKQPRKTRISFDALNVSSLCKVNSSWSPVTIYIDGICEPLLKRTGAATISNHPNPFMESTTITYTIPVDGGAVMRLLDAQGREVRRLLDAWMPVGDYTHSFDSSNLPAGDYLAVLETSTGSTVRRLVILK